MLGGNNGCWGVDGKTDSVEEWLNPLVVGVNPQVVALEVGRCRSESISWSC